MKSNHKDQYCFFRYINQQNHEEIKIYNLINSPAPMSIEINGILHIQNIAQEPFYYPGYNLAEGDLFFDAITKSEAEQIAEIRTDSFEKTRGKMKRASRRQYFRYWVEKYTGSPIVRNFVKPMIKVVE